MRKTLVPLALVTLLPSAGLPQAKRAGGVKQVTSSIRSVLSSASYGDTVQVPAGTFRECLTITTGGIQLVGAGADQTRVECDGLALKVSSANDVTIRGITFAKVGTFNKSSAVWFDGGGGNFTNNKVRTETSYGLAGFEVNCAGGTWVIEDNEMYGAPSSGIYIHGYGSVRVARNKIEKSGSAAIYLEELASATVEANRIDTTGAAGIFVLNSPARVAKNDIRRAKYAGVEVKGSSMSGVIESNWIQDNLETGVFANVGSSPRVLKNVMWKNGLHGVVAKNATVTAEENTIVQCGEIGMLSYAGGVLYARRNIVSGCGRALSLTPPTGESTGSLYHSDNVFWNSKWGHYQAISKDPSEKELDPVFVNEMGGDFHLSQSSPLFGGTIKYGAYAPSSVSSGPTRTALPPNLEMTASFDDSSGNGDRTLDAGERALVVLKIKNSGRGPGFDVKASVGLKYDNPSITMGAAQNLGKMDQGDTKVVQISISGEESLVTGDVELNAQVRERDGFDAEPIAIRLRTRSRAMPELKLVRYTIRDADGTRSAGNGNGRIEKGELIEVLATVTNRGQGPADTVKVGLSSGSNDVLITSPPADLGALAAGAWKEASLSFSVNRRYAGTPRLPLTLQGTESRSKGNFSEALELTLDSSVPQGKVLTVEAVRENAAQAQSSMAGPSGPVGFVPPTVTSHPSGPGPGPAAAAPAAPRKPIVAGTGDRRPTILVLDIAAPKKKFDEDLIDALSDRVRGVIVRSGNFLVVSRDQMDAILKEQKFAKSEACDETSCFIEMGRALSAEYMATGKLSKVGKTHTLTLQFVDVNKFATINSAQMDCKSCEDESLLEIADVTAGDLIYTK